MWGVFPRLTTWSVFVASIKRLNPQENVTGDVSDADGSSIVFLTYIFICMSQHSGGKHSFHLRFTFPESRLGNCQCNMFIVYKFETQLLHVSLCLCVFVMMGCGTRTEERDISLIKSAAKFAACMIEWRRALTWSDMGHFVACFSILLYVCYAGEMMSCFSVQERKRIVNDYWFVSSTNILITSWKSYSLTPSSVPSVPQNVLVQGEKHRVKLLICGRHKRAVNVTLVKHYGYA